MLDMARSRYQELSPPHTGSLVVNGTFMQVGSLNQDRFFDALRCEALRREV
jgi:hypothetical protein